MEGPVRKRRKLNSHCSTESTESILSIQDKETVCARDTSDTDWSSSENPDVNNREEYEVAELSDPDNPLLQEELTSEESEHTLNEVKDIAELGALVAAVIYDSEVDIGLNGDISTECPTTPSSTSDADPELPKSDLFDFSHCAQCKKWNTDSNYQYCNRCYRAKKQFYPPRPKKRVKTVQHKYKKENGDEKKILFSQTKDKIDDLSIDCVDGMLPSSLHQSNSSQESGVGSLECEDWCKPSCSKNLSVGENLFKESKTIKLDEQDEDSLCRLCFLKPINSVFVHGKVACLHTCYGCALKSWARCGCCPFCRSKVSQVLKISNNVHVTFNNNDG